MLFEVLYSIFENQAISEVLAMEFHNLIKLYNNTKETVNDNNIETDNSSHFFKLILSRISRKFLEFWRVAFLHIAEFN